MMNNEIKKIKTILSKDCVFNCPANKSCRLCEAEKIYNADYRKAEEVRKETAREILQKIYNGISDDIITKWDTDIVRGYNTCIYKLQNYIEALCKDYDVEVEE